VLSYFPKKAKSENVGQSADNKRFRRVYLADLQGKKATLVTSQQVPRNNQGYSYSFSSFGKHANPQLNRKEKLNQLKSKLRRKKI
jgi:hypothetical protein